MKTINKIINKSGYKRIWCPLCEQERPRSKYICNWLSPPPNLVLVCYYCVCEACVKFILSTNISIQVKAADRIEENLLKRYPKLIHKLPAGYAGDTTTVIE